MILTVTPNPALDLTWHVPHLDLGESHRAPTGVGRAGGKGINVARALHADQAPVLALTTAGGAVGDEFTTELRGSGIPFEIIPTRAQTRRSLALVDEATGEATVINELGEPLTDRESIELLRRTRELAIDAEAVAICGSLPRGLDANDLAGLVADVVASGVPVLVDTSGPGLRCAARASASILKPNLEELREATGCDDPVDGARTLLDDGAQLIVVTLGSEGLWIVDAAGASIRARLGAPVRGNPTGAGDAAVAAILRTIARTGLRLGDRAALADLARTAVAWSASAVLAPLAGDLSDRTADLLDDVVILDPIPEHS
ncbi:1-phosphofructokinase family hexose kinase [Microbacterium sp. B2969]|uniref:1-phosphofructokinase family hexose kinase n=1 Tax=Microbacterium alkaliflavum TaxID=3248839 RepID=A0ABW7Q403_9MICO